jgi:hypothetical protein
MIQMNIALLLSQVDIMEVVMVDLMGIPRGEAVVELHILQL